MVDSQRRVVAASRFTKWLSRLDDRRAVGRILVRIERLARDHAGDAKVLGGGLSELRISTGPGYRVYFAEHRGNILLLGAGDKATQQRDIAAARRVLADWRYGDDD